MADTPDTDLLNAADLASRFSDLSQFDNILVAVSGGSDSVALLRMLDRWVMSTGIDRSAIHVLTVDHGLRSGSGDDADFVEATAATLGYQHRTLVWSGPKPSSGLQTTARNARYSLLTEAAAAHSGTSVILTAHTRDDQAETVLMRLARGSGPDGLSAIPTSTNRDGVAIHRPLLDVTRAQLVAVLQSLQQDWREDPSNSLTEFERIRVRKARPDRQRLGLSDKALAQTARRMRQARQSLELIASELLSSNANHQIGLRLGVFEWQPDVMGKYGPDVGIRCLRRVIHVIGGHSSPPNLSQTEKLYAELTEADFRGATLHGTRLAVVQDEGLQRHYMMREPGRSGLPTVDLEPNMDGLWDGRFGVRTGSQLPPGYSLRPLRQQDGVALDTQSIAGLPACLRADVLLTLPAIWRDNTLLVAPHFAPPPSGIRVDTSQILNSLCNGL